MHASRLDKSRSRWLALVVLCAGMLMIILDQTIVNVALPAIQHDLGFSQSSLAWVVNAYLIPFGGLLLLAGRFRARAVLLPGLRFTPGWSSPVCARTLDADYVCDILSEMLLIGVGGGLSFPALMTLAKSDTSTGDAGLALGLAVLATISTARSQELLVSGASPDSALTGGYDLAFGISAGPVQKSVVRAASENRVGHV